RRPGDEDDVRLGGDHDAHVDAAPRRGAERRQDRGPWDEVGRGDPDPLLGLGEGQEVGVVDPGLAVGAAGDDGQVDAPRVGEELGLGVVFDQLVGGEVPVVEEDVLQVEY